MEESLNDLPGQDEAGEIYLVGYEGMIYRIDFSGAVFE